MKWGPKSDQESVLRMVYFVLGNVSAIKLFEFFSQEKKEKEAFQMAAFPESQKFPISAGRVGGHCGEGERCEGDPIKVSSLISPSLYF